MSDTVLRKITGEDIPVLEEMLARDDHDAWAPTHVIEKDGEVLGSVSIDGIPLCTVFISSEVNSPLVVRQVGKEMDRVLKSYGDKGYFVVAGPKSPVRKLMPLGDYVGYNTTLWYKDI